jgi:preprotein translocase subunit YajC
MFATPAYAQTAAAAGAGGAGGILQLILPFLIIAPLFYFMILRPQQQRAKQHQSMIAAVKRGDTVVMSSGMIGKVVRVEAAEIGVEIATGVTVKVIKSMIAEIRVKGEVAAANDAKT